MSPMANNEKAKKLFPVNLSIKLYLVKTTHFD